MSSLPYRSLAKAMVRLSGEKLYDRTRAERLVRRRLVPSATLNTNSSVPSPVPFTYPIIRPSGDHWIWAFPRDPAPTTSDASRMGNPPSGLMVQKPPSSAPTNRIFDPSGDHSGASVPPISDATD